MIEPHTNFDFDGVEPTRDATDGAAEELVILNGLIEAAASSDTPATCFAALLVIRGRFTVAEASRQFRVSHSTVQRAVARLQMEMRSNAILDGIRKNVRRTSADKQNDQ